MKFPPDRVLRLGDRVVEQIRHRDAFRISSPDPGARGFGGIAAAKHVLLTSFRIDGTPVPTVVWFAVDGSRLYVRTEVGTYKLKRIARDPRVLLTPCNFRGRPLGPTCAGRARETRPEERPGAEAALHARYGRPRTAFEDGLSAVGIASTYVLVEENPGALGFSATTTS